jgi:hypothetical protein
VRRVAALVLLLVAGCFDSLVGSPCAPGFAFVQGRCVEPGPDGGPGTGVCELPLSACQDACVDLSDDPDNCGACGRMCASGICTAGHCQGTLSGHIVAVGHDYQHFHSAMARVLGNALALGGGGDLGIAFWRGSASAAAATGAAQAVISAMAAMGHSWHPVTIPTAPLSGMEDTALDGVDALLIEAQAGNGAAVEAAGATWAVPIDRLLQRGGAVVVLHGVNGVSHRFAQGAGLYVVAAPVIANDLEALVLDTNDAVTQQVVSPYLAEAGSVAFVGVPAPVIATRSGEAYVFHRVRY